MRWWHMVQMYHNQCKATDMVCGNSSDGFGQAGRRAFWLPAHRFCWINWGTHGSSACSYRIYLATGVRFGPSAEILQEKSRAREKVQRPAHFEAWSSCHGLQQRNKKRSGRLRRETGPRSPALSVSNELQRVTRWSPIPSSSRSIIWLTVRIARQQA